MIRVQADLKNLHSSHRVWTRLRKLIEIFSYRVIEAN